MVKKFYGGFHLTSTSYVKIDHLLTFETDEQKQEFERICKTSSNVQRYKKKLIQRAYEKIEKGLKDLSELTSKTIKEFQLEKYKIHPSVNHFNRISLEEQSKFVFDCGQLGFRYNYPCDCGKNEKNVFKYLFAHIPCGNNKTCPICSRFVAMQRMSSIYRFFTLLDFSDTDEMDFWFAYPILTYPKGHLEKTIIIEKLQQIDLSKLNTVTIESIRQQKTRIFDKESFILSKEEIYDKMFEHSNIWKREIFDKKRKGKLQNRVASLNIPHSWSSKNPLSSDSHNHVHCIIPELVFHPIVEKSQVPVKKIIIGTKTESEVKIIMKKSRKIVGYSKPKKIIFHRSLEELKEMREVWAKTIGYDSEVNIHWKYGNSRKKLVHYLKYILRSYVQDLNKELIKNDEKKPLIFSKAQNEIVQYHSSFKTGFKRIRWFGYLSNSLRKGFLNYFVPEMVRDILSQLDYLRKVCPICFHGVGDDKPIPCDFDSEKMLRVVYVNPLMLELQNQELKDTFDSRVKIKKG